MPQNMLEAIKLGNILHNVSDPDYRNWLTPAETLRMATAGGARGVNLGNTTGTISPGMEADLVLYDLGPSFYAAPHRAAASCWSWVIPPRW